MALDLGGLASASPWGAAANALGGALTTSQPSTANQGPTTSGPKTINVSGFGGRSSGSATQSLTQAEPDRGDSFPMTSIGDGAGFPAWVIPAAAGLLLLVVVASFVGRV